MMLTVQAVEFGGPEVLRPIEAEAPTPGPDEVLIDVAAAEVLFLDTQLRAGWGQEYFSIRPPFVPGVGVAGTVVDAGEQVDPEWIGRRLIASTSGPHEYRGGGYAEQTTAVLSRAVEIPDQVGYVDALAALSDGVMGVTRAELAALRPGDTALITAAAGSIGTWLIPLLSKAGVQVIGAARGATKLELITRLGAASAIDYGTEDWIDQVPPELAAVFDGAGGAVGTAALDRLRRGGQFFSYGAAAGDFADVSTAEQRGIRVTGIEEDFPIEAMLAVSGRAMKLLADRTITPVIGQAVPLAKAAEAHAAMEERRVLGKTVLVTEAS